VFISGLIDRQGRAEVVDENAVCRRLSVYDRLHGQRMK
jgi:hypothetical protein